MAYDIHTTCVDNLSRHFARGDTRHHPADAAWRAVLREFDTQDPDAGHVREFRVVESHRFPQYGIVDPDLANVMQQP